MLMRGWLTTLRRRWPRQIKACRRNSFPNRTRHDIEALENRVLLTGSITLNGVTGQIEIVGSSAVDTADLSFDDATTVRVTLDTTTDSHLALFNRAQVNAVVFDGLASDDVFTNLTDIPSIADGGAGNDTLIGGSGADSMVGGAGIDYLNGAGSDDTLDGGTGNDVVFGGSGRDYLIGGDGDDLVDGNGSSFDTIVGGPGNDTLNGGAGTDVLIESGNVSFVLTNTQLTGMGTDQLSGIQFAELTAGDGNNLIDVSAFSGQTTLSAGAGNDTILGSSAFDELIEGGNEINIILTDTQLIGSGTNVISNIDAVWFKAGIANNVIDLSGFSGRATVMGNAGDDYVVGGPGVNFINTGAGRDTVFGGGGNDVIYGGAGRDYIDGGPGNDNIKGQGSSFDTIVSSSGDDTLNGGAGTDVLIGTGSVEIRLRDTVLTGNGRDRLYNFELAHITGSAGDDLIDAREFSGPTTLIGGGGNDWILGSQFNDRIEGGTGNDSLRGEDGNDIIVGGTGNDSVYGDDGNDRLFSQEGDDLLRGGNGDDELQAADGNDELRGDAGDDLLVGAAGNDSLFGFTGDDTLQGGTENDSLRGSAGFDILLGEAGDDTLDGDAGKDSVNGGDGNDIVKGGDGDDLLFGEAGTDDLTGGLGNDLLDGGTGLSTQSGEGGNDTLIGNSDVDVLLGGDDNDDLRGFGGNDVLDGENGDDMLAAGAGDDFLRGSAGDDTLDGGAGADHLTGADGNDVLNGDGDDDTLIGDAGNDALNGGGGVDQLYGNDGSDTLSGDDGNDLLYGHLGADSLDGDLGNDYLDGNADNDTINGGGGIDTVLGFDGNDVLNGDDGDDSINGGLGNDAINGGGGNDILLGVDGTDTLNGDGDRDLVIGGHAADIVIGGDGDDVVIGGETLYRTDATALTAILATWTSDGNYNTRVAALENISFASVLQSAATANDVTSTVYTDYLIDTVTGGTGLDWFMQPGETGSPVLDQLVDVSAGESVNLPLSSGNGSATQWFPAAIANPNYLQTIADPTFGSPITRLTGNPGVQFSTVFNTGGTTDQYWGGAVRNRYVTDSAWNADGSLIHLRSYDPDQQFHAVLNATTFQPQFVSNTPTTNYRWGQDPSRPNLQYAFVDDVAGANNDQIIESDVVAGVVNRTITLPFNKTVSGKDTIAFSGGRQYVALLGRDKANPSAGVYVYVVDLDYNEQTESPVVASMLLTGSNCGMVNTSFCDNLHTNTLSYSPDSRHILVSYGGPDEFQRSWRLLDVNLSTGTITPHAVPDLMPDGAQPGLGSPAAGHFHANWSHPTFALGQNGQDVYIVGYSGNWRSTSITGVETVNGLIGNTLAFNVSNNTYRSLTDPQDEAFVSHVSATNLQNPGYVFVSYVSDINGGTKYRGEIVAINLEHPGDTINGVIPLVHHRTNEANDYYGAQPHVVASPDGTQLIFPSTWGPSQSVVSSYRIDFETPPATIDLDSTVIDENETVNVTGHFLAAANPSAHTVSINWGDGSSSAATVNTSNRTFSASHQYLDDNPTSTPSDNYTVTVTMTETGPGTVRNYSTTVTVNNSLPVATIANVPDNAPEGSPVNLSASVTDAGSADTFVYSWSVTGGPVTAVTGATAANFSFTPTQNGTYVVNLTVTDDDGGVSTTAVESIEVKSTEFNSGTGALTVSISGNDSVVISSSSGILVVNVNGVAVTSIGTVAATAVNSIVVTGGSGGNNIDLSAVTVAAFSNPTVTIDAAGGNDTITGSELADNIQGGNGGDILTGGLGSDTINGGSGTDLLIESGDVNMTLSNSQMVGLGTDSLSNLNAAQLTGGASGNNLDAGGFSGPVTIVGGGGSDTIRGGSANDLLQGEAGDDFINGGDGDDLLYGGAGHDGLAGNAGNDYLNASAGNDTLVGGTEDDILFGGGGTDLMVGGAGDDHIAGQGSSFDTLAGGAGNDRGVDFDVAALGNLLSEIDESFANFTAGWID